MPPTAKSNASVILYDVRTPAAFAAQAEKCLLNICASKWFLKSKDTTKLILLNTRETENSIHSKFGKCPHVFEATEAVAYDPKLIKEKIEDVETAEADWLMGLAVALEALEQNFYQAKGVQNLQLLFITNFSTPVKAKSKRIDYVIENLNKMNVNLYILGPKVKLPTCLSSFEEIRNWSKNVEFSTDQDNPDLNIAKQIVTKSNGIICDLELGQELFKSYVNRWGLQAWKVPLTIGSSLIQCSTTRFLRPVDGPKFKEETLGPKEPWKWHLTDDILEEVPYDHVIGGVYKHNKFVPLPQDVEKLFKYQGLRSFKIIGFTDKRNIPEFYMRGNGSSYVDSDGSKNFKLLVHVLAKQNKCIIARRSYMANNKPKLMVLVPQTTEGIFLMAELPYGDSLRADFAEQDINEAPEIDRSNPAVEAMYEYLGKLDVTNPANRDENGCVQVPLSANLTDNIRQNLLSQRCLSKYLDDGSDMPDVNVKLPNFTDASDYKKFIPVRQVEVKKAKQ